MPFILQTNGLSKKIGSKTLVTDVDIHIPKGEIYGFLGPNGAGKTTVMKMITNLWKPTSGTIEVFGEVLTPKSYEVLKRMGSIIEFPTFYDHMTGRQNLQLHCEYMGYYNVDSVESALQMLDLTAAADQPVKSYSLGMKERLGISRAIMCKPELLILDEPTNGLDPAGMKQIRDLLKTLCSEYGITAVSYTHLWLCAGRRGGTLLSLPRIPTSSTSIVIYITTPPPLTVLGNSETSGAPASPSVGSPTDCALKTGCLL